MGFPSNIYNRSYNTYELPPTTVSKTVKQSKAWKESMLDAFEHIAVDQFHENLSFTDYYRAYEGKLSYQELSQVAPHMSDLQGMLDGVGIPSFLRHHDVLGIIINGLTGQYLNFRDKFHVTDIGEIAQNEFLRHKNDQAKDLLEGVIKNTVDMALAKAGFDPDGREFDNPEEQQQYMQQLDQAREAFTPKDTFRATSSTFKTLGILWGEAVLEKDKESKNFNELEKEEIKDYLLSGRCFRHFRIGQDEYDPERWDPKGAFFSKEIESKQVQKGEYVGRLQFYTPAECIRRYGHKIDSRKQKELLGGRDDWKAFVTGDGYFDGFLGKSGSIEKSISSNFNTQAKVPFSNYSDYNFYLALQEDLNIPMGVQTLFNDDGTTSENERFLPRLQGDHHGRYRGYAEILRSDFEHRLDLCQVTEVYFRAYDLWGYLTYIDESGMVVTEEVTEDILKDFLRENNITQKFTESLVEIVEDFEPGTLKWVYRPVVYEGVKIQSENLNYPLYLYVNECEHQIKGDSDFEVLLPVAGIIGNASVASKIEPWQAKHNLAMNQVYSLLEKELGMFFLMDTDLIPSEYDEWGDAEEALMALRNVAKNVGIMPTATTPDGRGLHNQFATYNLSNSTQINDRIRIAEFTKSKAYEVVGITPPQLNQPNDYKTAEGVKQSQEAGYAQTADIFETFNLFVKGALELHLSVAQYCQSNNKDTSLYYTKSDGSVAFLKMTDPDFPLRRIGLIATQDSGKRKQLETYKSYLLNTNTIGSDTLEIAKLISSDAMSEAVEIARVATERRIKQQNESTAQQNNAVMEQIESKKQADQFNWEREEESKQKDRIAKIQVAEIQATGRAADKKSDEAGFRAIERAADIALKENKQLHDQEMDINKFKAGELKDTEEKNRRMEELKLKTRELEEKIKQRKSNEFIATVNKN